jgi:hypothetical protein
MPAEVVVSSETRFPLPSPALASARSAKLPGTLVSAG